MGFFGPPNIKGMEAKKDVKGLTKALKDKDKAVRVQAVMALGHIRDMRAVEPLIETLKDEDEDVRAQAAGALGHMGDKRVVEPLIEAMRDKHKLVREGATRSLKYIGRPAIESLIKAMKDKNVNIRRNAVVALRFIGDARALEAVVQASKDEDEGVRAEVALALEDIRYARIFEEGARGIGIDPEADTLMQLMVEAYDWGRNSGFPHYKEYPQYEPVRSIGEMINRKGGIDAMRRNWSYIRAENWQLGSILEGFWDGIGGWRS